MVKIVKLDDKSYGILYQVKCSLREQGHETSTFGDAVRALAMEVVGTTLYNHPLLLEGRDLCE